jgi:glutamate N-acetyltransferase / amino-acid N-acetyltransferase
VSFTSIPEGGVCAAKGFLAAGVAAGIKKKGGLDLALIVSEETAVVAGTFTTSLAAAAPVIVSRARIANGVAKGVVVNSGCANACTGERGYGDAVAMADAAAKAVGVAAEEMLVCSTGLIGAPNFLPVEKVRLGIEVAAAGLRAGDGDARRAIMTTDTRPKFSAVAHSDGWRLGGITKGAAMLAPNMATMLAFITTDAKVEAGVLQAALGEVVDATFNNVRIDGDTSTNDTVLAFANGVSGVQPDPESFAEALHIVCGSLAEQIASDGEGSTRFARVRVVGAAGDAEAKAGAQAIGTSMLFKASLHGGDPNWGRVAAILGRCGIAMELSKLSISIDDFALFVHGEAVEGVEAQAREALGGDDKWTVVCDLGLGGGAAEVLTCDLSPEYVRLNASEY